jgi:hypothetical protein
MSDVEQGVLLIVRVARRAERRIRFGRALRIGSVALCAAIAAVVAGVALRKLGFVDDRPLRALIGAAGTCIVLAGATAWMWRLPERAGARALDRFHGLHDRLASALSFASLAPTDRTPFMQAATEDAIVALGAVSPRRAVPIPLPRSLAAAGALAVVLLAVTLSKVHSRGSVVHAKTIDPLEMAPDDLEDIKDFLKQVEQRGPSDDTNAAVAEFNKIVDDIANRRLDRTEAFRRMQALEEKLLMGSPVDRKTLEKRLEAIGEQLKKAELARPAAAALANEDLGKASDELRKLAQKMRDRATPVDKAKLDQLREALKKAAEQARKSHADALERRQQLADDILKMKQNLGDGGPDEERSLLEKKQQELERLDRDLDQQKSANGQLDRLDRELEQAAEDLMKDLGLSAQDLERGAEDLNRMDEQQLTQQEKEELRQKLQELRELLRQQGQGGKGQVVRLKRFGRMARGQAGQGSGQKGGEPSDGQSSQSGQEHESEGPAGGSQGGETWVLGPNGEKVLMLSSGARAGGQDPGGGGGAPSQRGWGEGHDPKLQGKATNPKMTTQDTHVQGSDTGQGGSRSQVISGAAERGFATRNYRKVYTEYHQVAEESLAKDEIPGGYRFYVKRYFQLIRPREGEP